MLAPICNVICFLTSNTKLIPLQDRRYFKQQEITLWRKGPSKEKKIGFESDATKKLE